MRITCGGDEHLIKVGPRGKEERDRDSECRQLCQWISTSNSLFLIVVLIKILENPGNSTSFFPTHDCSQELGRWQSVWESGFDCEETFGLASIPWTKYTCVGLSGREWSLEACDSGSRENMCSVGFVDSRKQRRGRGWARRVHSFFKPTQSDWERSEDREHPSGALLGRWPSRSHFLLFFLLIMVKIHNS